MEVKTLQIMNTNHSPTNYLFEIKLKNKTKWIKAEDLKNYEWIEKGYYTNKPGFRKINRK